MMCRALIGPHFIASLTLGAFDVFNGNGSQRMLLFCASTKPFMRSTSFTVANISIHVRHVQKPRLSLQRFHVLGSERRLTH